jgi:HlyD family secretion protein
LLAASCILTALTPGCQSENPKRVQGYVEGEFVYLATPAAGLLETLYVQRGMQVPAGAPLFALDATPQRAARAEAERRLAQGHANWEDAKKGKRAPEIESVAAQLRQAQAGLELSTWVLAREQALLRSRAAAVEEQERARATNEQDRQKVAQLEADLQTARLGARGDQIEAAAANVQALEAALARAEWDLAQQRQHAPQGGLVFDTLFREGEWVAAARPVVVLLPPQNIKVRAFVPQARIGALSLGQKVQVSVDGVSEPYAGAVRFISPQAEYTPPVIYSRESRSKLVFMIEIFFEPESAGKLHPGQPVDVYLGLEP